MWLRQDLGPSSFSAARWVAGTTDHCVVTCTFSSQPFEIKRRRRRLQKIALGSYTSWPEQEIFPSIQSHGFPRRRNVSASSPKQGLGRHRDKRGFPGNRRHFPIHRNSRCVSGRQPAVSRGFESSLCGSLGDQARAPRVEPLDTRMRLLSPVAPRIHACIRPTAA